MVYPRVVKASNFPKHKIKQRPFCENNCMYNTNPKFFCRPVRKNDLVMPDEARVVAREFGIHYYETSVLTYYGVNEVFENAIRAALISRRRQRFWMTNLKKVQRPLLQVGTTIRIYILIYRYRLLNVGKSIVHSSFAPKKVPKYLVVRAVSASLCNPFGFSVGKMYSVLNIYYFLLRRGRNSCIPPYQNNT